MLEQVDKKLPRRIGIQQCENETLLTEMHDPISIKDLSIAVGLGTRAIRIRVRKLIDEGLVIKIINLHDMRYVSYQRIN